MWNVDSTIRMMRDMSQSTDPDQLTQVFAAQVRRTLHLDRALVISRRGLDEPHYRILRTSIWNERTGSFIESRPDEIRERGILAEVLYAGEMRLMPGLSVPPTDPAHDLLCDQKSLMAFPMFDNGDTAGMLVLLSSQSRACDASELCGLAMMSGLLGRAIQAQLLVRQVESTCRALDRELEAAADVQRWLLPPTIPVLPGASIAASYRTATQSGGDYYDVAELPNGKLGLLIADVSGKGASAAVLAAVVRTIVQLDESRWVMPSALLYDINRHLCDLGLPDRGAFVTAFCGVLDTHSGRLIYSSAGHHPPRLVRARQERLIELAGARSLPLGFDSLTRYTHESAVLLPGDAVLLYTDGIVDARSPEHEFFGAERLDQVLRNLPMPLSSQMVVQAVVEATAEFSGWGAPSDDQTLLAVTMAGLIER